MRDEPGIRSLVLGLHLSNPSMLVIYADIKKDVTRSKVTLTVLSCFGPRRSAMAAAAHPSSALSAATASCSRIGHGKHIASPAGEFFLNTTRLTYCRNALGSSVLVDFQRSLKAALAPSPTEPGPYPKWIGGGAFDCLTAIMVVVAG